MDFCFNGEVNPNYATDNCILFNEDCRKVLDNIKDESIDLFCSDIPYKISKKEEDRRNRERNMLEVYLIV